MCDDVRRSDTVASTATATNRMGRMWSLVVRAAPNPADIVSEGRKAGREAQRRAIAPSTRTLCLFVGGLVFYLAGGARGARRSGAAGDIRYGRLLCTLWKTIDEGAPPGRGQCVSEERALRRQSSSARSSAKTMPETDTRPLFISA